MEQLQQGFILALATVKNKLVDLMNKYDTLLNERNIIQNAMVALKEQRNTINNEYKILKNMTDETKSTLQKKIKEKEIEVEILQNNLHELKDKSKQLEKNKLEFQLITCYEEFNTCNKELNTCNKKLVKCYEELLKYKKQDNLLLRKVQKLESELRTKENDLDKLLEKQELHMLRTAHTTFERHKIEVRDPKCRAEYWSSYFEEGIAKKKKLEKVELKGNLKNTVIALFLRMNVKAHEVYPLEQIMTIRESTISPNEQKLIRALWQLSPLRKGSLKIHSDKE